MTINYISDILERPISRLPMQFKDKEGIEELLEIFVEELFELQEVFQDINGLLDLDAVEGYWLDQIGLVLDEPRAGDDDETYRTRMQMRIFFNKSEGTEEYVVEAIRFLTGGENVQLTDAGFANLTAVTDGGNLDQDVIDELKRLLAATVLLTLESTFSGANFTTVDVTPDGDTDYVNNDTGLTDYKYYDDPDAGKWYQDYLTLTTADITIDSSNIGEKHSVFINSNFVEYVSEVADVDLAAAGLAALIDALPDVSASSSLEVITVTGTAFTLAAISQNTTMDPAWLSENGGVLLDVIQRDFPAQTSTPIWGEEEGTSKGAGGWAQNGTLPTGIGTEPASLAKNSYTKDLYVSKSDGTPDANDHIYKRSGDAGSYVSIGASFPGAAPTSALLAVNSNPLSGDLWALDGFEVPFIYTGGVGPWTSGPTHVNELKAVAIHDESGDAYFIDWDQFVTNLVVLEGGTAPYTSLPTYPGLFPSYIDVDQSTGDLIVGDFGDNKIWRLSSGVWSEVIDLDSTIVSLSTGPDSKIYVNSQGGSPIYREISVIALGDATPRVLPNPTWNLFIIEVDSEDDTIYISDRSGTDEVYKYSGEVNTDNVARIHSEVSGLVNTAYSIGRLEEVYSLLGEPDYLYYSKTDNEIYRQDLITGVETQFGTFPGNAVGRIETYVEGAEGIQVVEASPTDATSDRLHRILDDGAGGTTTTSYDGLPSGAIVADVMGNQYVVLANPASSATTIYSITPGGTVTAVGDYPGTAPEKAVMSKHFGDASMAIVEGTSVYTSQNSFDTYTEVVVPGITGIADICMNNSNGDIYIVDTETFPNIYVLFTGYGEFVRWGKPLVNKPVEDISIDELTGTLWINQKDFIFKVEVPSIYKWRTEDSTLPGPHHMVNFATTSSGGQYAINDSGSGLSLQYRASSEDPFVEDTSVPQPTLDTVILGSLTTDYHNDTVYLGLVDQVTFDFWTYKKVEGGSWELESSDSLHYKIALAADKQGTGDIYYLSFDAALPGNDPGVFVKYSGASSFVKLHDLPTSAFPIGGLTVSGGVVYASSDQNEVFTIRPGEVAYTELHPFDNLGSVGQVEFHKDMREDGTLFYLGRQILNPGASYFDIAPANPDNSVQGGFRDQATGEVYYHHPDTNEFHILKH